MSYELIVNSRVQGAEQTEQLGASVDRLTDRTKRVDAAIQSYLGSNDKLLAKHLELSRAEANLEGLRERHRMQTERLSASIDRTAASQERLNLATRHTVTDVQAASAAIRTFEGTLPIRAVEQFVTKVLGFGPALQIIFPLVGAAAMIEVLDRMAEKVKGVYDNYISLKTAQAEVTRGARELATEFERSFASTQRLQIQALRNQGRLVEAAQLENRQAASVPIRLPQLNEDKLKGLNSQQIAGLQGAYSEVIPADLGQRIKEVNNRLFSVQQDLADYAAGGPVRFGAGTPRQLEVQRDALSGLLQFLRQRQAEFTAEQQLGQSNIQKARLEEAKKASEGLAAAIERVTEAEKRAAEELNRATGRESFGARLSSDIANVRAETADELRRSGRTPALASRITRAGAIREYGVIQGAETAAARGLNQFNTEAPVEAEAIGERIAAAQAKYLESIVPGISFLRAPGLPTAPGGYISPERQLRDVQDSGRRNLGLFALRSQIRGDRPDQQISGEYSLRIATAREEYEAEKRIADLKATEAEKQMARLNAEDSLRQKIFDAELERDRSLLENIAKQKEALERGLTTVFDGIRSGNLGSVVKQRIEAAIEKAIVDKLADLWARSRGNNPNQPVSIGDVLGDAAKTSTDQNTAATKDNTDALKDLTAQLRSGGGGGLFPAGPGGISFPSGSGGPGIMYGFPGSGGSGGAGGGGGLGTVGKIAGAGLAAYSAYQDFSRGGASGDVQGVGDLAMGAAAFTGPAAPFVFAGGAALKLIGSLFNTGPQARAAEIQRHLKYNQFVAPVSLNESFSTAGGYSDYDYTGAPRTSGFSPVPTVEQPYFDYRHGVTVPGRLDSSFGPVIVNNNIQAMDAQSFHDYLQQNPDALASGVANALQRGGNDLPAVIRSQVS